MSLLSPNRLRIALAPDHLTVVRLVGRLRPRIDDVQVLPVGDTSEGALPWEAAVQALGRVLPGLVKPGEPVTLVLSNHFCRYQVLAAVPALASDEEEQAWLRHCWTEVYGEAAQGWMLRVSGDSPAVARLSAAVDERLVALLRTAVRDAGGQLVSIQPYLMRACNAWRAELGRQAVWFALYEPGRLCLALCTAEGVAEVRGLPAGPHWQQELPLLVARETTLREGQPGPNPVETLVFHHDHATPPRLPALPAGLRGLTLPPAAVGLGEPVAAATLALVGD